MKQSEAVRALGLLAAAYRTTIPDETLAVWSESLSDYELTDLVEAVHIAAESSVFLPPLADLRQMVVECRNDRLRAERKALPEAEPGDGTTFSEYLVTHEDERNRVLALVGRPTIEGNPAIPGLVGILAAEQGRRTTRKRP